METVYESLGLSPNETKIYLSLIETGEATISEIAISAQIHRRNAYDAISRLVNKGLCFEIFSGQGNHYRAVDPNKLSELLAEKQQQLDQMLPELKKKFSKQISPEEAYIYRGLEGQKNIFRDMVRVSKDSYFIGAKGGWFDPRLDSSREALFKASVKQKFKFIQLFDFATKGHGINFPQNFPNNLEYRFLPKEYSTSSAIHIFGDYVITYTGLDIGVLPDDLVFFVLRSNSLAESYRTWFKYMWDQSSGT